MSDPHALPGSDVVLQLDGGPLRLRVVRHGPADGPALLLLHGVGATSYLWRDVVRDLGRHCLVLAPDAPGAGGSERPTDPTLLSPAGQAGVLIGLLDALGVDRAVVVGAGLGGATAVHLAAAAPERVAGLALLGSPLSTDAWPPRAALPLLPLGLGEAVVGLSARVPAIGDRVVGGLLGGADAGPHARDGLARDGGRALLATLRAADLAVTAAAWRLVCAAPVPTMVLWGEQDQVLDPSYGRRLVAEMPGAQWVPVQGDHLLPCHRPERVAEELAAFAAECLAPA